ncbi:MAG: hypothetical protein K1X53_01550 [Candidatus Sumerlaeaceae bacterium]|nr:hypothetical protein [Candidatus Sumerlaeaceae bacterium]
MSPSETTKPAEAESLVKEFKKHHNCQEGEEWQCGLSLRKIQKFLEAEAAAKMKAVPLRIFFRTRNVSIPAPTLHNYECLARLLKKREDITLIPGRSQVTEDQLINGCQPSAGYKFKDGTPPAAFDELFDILAGKTKKPKVKHRGKFPEDRADFPLTAAEASEIIRRHKPPTTKPAAKPRNNMAVSNFALNPALIDFLGKIQPAELSGRVAAAARELAAVCQNDTAPESNMAFNVLLTNVVAPLIEQNVRFEALSNVKASLSDKAGRIIQLPTGLALINLSGGNRKVWLGCDSNLLTDLPNGRLAIDHIVATCKAIAANPGIVESVVGNYLRELKKPAE